RLKVLVDGGSLRLAVFPFLLTGCTTLGCFARLLAGARARHILRTHRAKVELAGHGVAFDLRFERSRATHAAELHLQCAVFERAADFLRRRATAAGPAHADRDCAADHGALEHQVE